MGLFGRPKATEVTRPATPSSVPAAAEAERGRYHERMVEQIARLPEQLSWKAPKEERRETGRELNALYRLLAEIDAAENVERQRIRTFGELIRDVAAGGSRVPSPRERSQILESIDTVLDAEQAVDEARKWMARNYPVLRRLHAAQGTAFPANVDSPPRLRLREGLRHVKRLIDDLPAEAS